jgi:hypothetical protein
MDGSEIDFFIFWGLTQEHFIFRSALGSENKNNRMRRRKMDP